MLKAKKLNRRERKAELGEGIVSSLGQFLGSFGKCK